MSFVVPSFQEVLHLIPPGINPFTIIMATLDTTVFPVIPNSSYVLLIVFGAGNLLTLFACLAVILVPFQRSQQFQKKHVWFFRAHYIAGSRCPLYIPNAGLAVAITQALANFLFLIYSILSYFSFKDREFSRKSYIYVWYDVCWLPGYLGFYMTAISALYTWLCSPTRDTTRNVLCRPVLLNLIFVPIPIFVTISCIAFSILIGHHHHNFFASYDLLLIRFRVAEAAWNLQKSNSTFTTILTNSPPDLLDPSNAYESLRSETISLMKILKYSSLNWICAALFLALFYMVAVIAFIMVIYSSFEAAKCGKTYLDENMIMMSKTEITDQDKKNVVNPYKKLLAEGLGLRSNSSVTKQTDQISHSEEEISSQPIIIQPSHNQLELKKSYRYLVKHCTLMVIALVFDIGVGFKLMLSVQQLTHATSRSVNSLLCCVDVIVISPAMLSQTWRIFNEKDVTPFSLSEEITSTRVITGVQNSPQETDFSRIR